MSATPRLAILLLLPAVALADEGAAVEIKAPPVDQGRREAGRQLYRGACATCHGERGDGKGPSARPLDPPPRDFTSGVYKIRSTASESLPLLTDVERTIRRGVPGTEMAGWGELFDEEQIRLLAELVLDFSPRYRGEALPEPLVVARPDPPPPTAPRLLRGEALYREMGCFKCHGPRGRGNGEAAPTLKDDRGRRIRPLDFTRGFYKGGREPGDVYRTFVTGMSGTPMPSYADAIPEEEDRWSLVHFVRSLSTEDALWRTLFGRFTPWE